MQRSRDGCEKARSGWVRSKSGSKYTTYGKASQDDLPSYS